MDYQHNLAQNGKNEDRGSRFTAIRFRLVRVLILAALCALPRPADAVPSPSLQVLNFQKKTALIPGLGAQSPSGEITLTLQDAQKDPNLQKLLRSAIYGGLSAEAYAERSIRDFEQRYKEAGKLLAEQGGPPRASYNWYYHEKASVVSEADGLLVLKHRCEYYEGGAHGNSEENYIVLDTADNRKLVLTDLIKDSSFPVLSGLIMEDLRKLVDIGPGEPLSKGGLLEDFVAPSSDFFLSREGIGFHWNPYEIAPYVYGHVEVLIPYKEANGLLTVLGQSAGARFSASTKR